MVKVSVELGGWGGQWGTGMGSKTLHSPNSTKLVPSLGARFPARETEMNKNGLAREGNLGPTCKQGIIKEPSNCYNEGMKRAIISLGFKSICFSRNYAQRETAYPTPLSPH